MEPTSATIFPTEVVTDIASTLYQLPDRLRNEIIESLLFICDCFAIAGRFTFTSSS